MTWSIIGSLTSFGASLRDRASQSCRTWKCLRTFGVSLTLAVALCLLATPSTLLASEKTHTANLAASYRCRMEVTLWDKTRCDLLADHWVGEVDYAEKWAEGIGQALYYGIVTNRRPFLFLLYQKGQERFVYRAQTVCAKYNIGLIPVRITER